MKKLRKVLAIILTVCMIAGFCVIPTVAGAVTNELKFNENGKFKIVIFSDTQDQYVIHPRLTAVMRQAIARENPDFIVFLGDQTHQNFKDADADVKRTLNQILAPVVEADIPYGFVFGNHDDQSAISGQNTDKDAMLRVYQSIGDCRTTDPNPSMTGTGTCNIPIYSSDGNDIAFNLWMIDSNPYQNMESRNGGYGCPQADQLQWLTDTNDALTQQEGHVVPSIAFQHVPMPQIYELLVAGSGSNSRYGKIAQLNDNATGYIGELPCPCPPDKDQGEFATLKAMGVQTLFTGHDHLNDFTGTYDGLTMTAVPGMTYLNYGDEAVRGYGVVELDESDLSDYDYHTVKFSTLDAEAGMPAEETYDVYDELTVSDLKKNGVAGTKEYNIAGGNLFTYDAASPSKSAVLKFRWTAGTETGVQFSFDKRINANGNPEMTYPFGVWIKKPDSTSPNGAWHLKPDMGSTYLANMRKVTRQGDTFDLEFGRLKVLTGAPEKIGTYYVYLKVNGQLVTSGYSAVDSAGNYLSANTDCHLSNEIFFADWSSYGNKISDIPVVETYEDYDEIGYVDLKTDGGQPLPDDRFSIASVNNLKYSSTSPTHSAILRFNWIAGIGTKSDIYMQVQLGGYSGNNNFGYRDNAGSWQYRGTDESKALGTTVNDGDIFNVEVARLKVQNGTNAGKYYTYFKVDDEVIFANYAAADDANSLLNDIVYFDGAGGGAIAPYAKVQEGPYEAYDEIGYSDLLYNGSPLGAETTMGTKVFTYNRTSPTGSIILKYRWKAVVGAKFQLCFDPLDGPAMSYMFGAQLFIPDENNPNGYISFRPGYGTSYELSQPIQDGRYYDVEFARLKVKSGPNKGKYYLYMKIGDILFAEDYIDAAVVDGNGGYVTKPGNVQRTLSNEIYLTFWNVSGNKISETPEAETFEAYDEIGYEDLLDNGAPVGNETQLGNRTFTYYQTSASASAIFKYRWLPGTGAESILSFDIPNDTSSNKYAYMFCVQIAKPSADYPNGKIDLRPGYSGGEIALPYALESGKFYDVEFARLKVKSGPNKGKYYVYFKMNDVLLAEEYVDANIAADGSYTTNWNNIPATLSNKIYITNWGGAKNSPLADLANNIASKF